MDKQIMLDWLLNDADQFSDDYFNQYEWETLQGSLNEMNGRVETPLPKKLPRSPKKMLPVLRQHFNDDVSNISLVLNHYFPDKYFFYRVSKQESEIFAGLEFFSEIAPEFEFKFDRVGKKGVARYLTLNDALWKFSKNQLTQLRYPQRLILYFLYQGLAPLFLENNDYRRYWVMVSTPEYYHNLDTDEDILWSARKDMQMGDLAFIYRTRPRSAITDLYRAKALPDFDPWGAWDGYWVELEKVCSMEDVTFKAMKADEVLGQWNTIRKNFQGVVTEFVPHSAYNRLLQEIPAKTRRKHNLQPEAVAAQAKSSGEYALEKDFENDVIVPLLKQWRFKFKRQAPCRFRIGSQTRTTKVDFLVHDSSGPLTLFENKLKIVNDKALQSAVEQGRSYALLLGIPSFVVAAPEGLWIYALNNNEARQVKTITLEELADKQQDEECRNLLLKLRGK